MVGGGVVGGAGGAAGGALLGAAGGAATGIVLGPPGMATGAAAGALGGAVGGGVVGSVGGAALGVKGVRRLAGRQPKRASARDGQLTRGDRAVIRATKIGGGLGGAWVGTSMGSLAGGPAGAAVGAVVGARVGSSSLGPGGRVERSLRIKRWRASDAGQKAKAEFISQAEAARQNKPPGIKGQLSYFKQVVKLQNEFDTRVNREALGRG
jgi:hypothetical protein